MNSVLIAPHNDDETLFAAYTIMRERPHVIVALSDPHNGRKREQETRTAVDWLTAGRSSVEHWGFDCSCPDWEGLSSAIGELARYDRVWAPAVVGEASGYVLGEAPENGWGVLQHEHLGWLAQNILRARVRRYCLYTRWHGRHKVREIVPTGVEIARKLVALSCYESAIADRATRSWFYENLDLREWTA